MSINHTPVGIVSESGIKYVVIPTDNGTPVFRHDRFHISNTGLSGELAGCGITVPNKQTLESIIHAVSDISHFENASVAEHPGWCGDHFVLPDGSMFGPAPGSFHVVFRPDAGLGQRRGDLNGWKAQVALKVRNHPVVVAAISAMFLPPLLRFMPDVPNITLELVGGADTGKSLVQQLAATVATSPDRIRSFREVQRDVNALRESARDFPLIIDHAEPALLTATKPKKAELYAAIAYDLPRGPGGRVTLLSGRQPLRDACAIATADDSILTLRVPDRGHGVFAKVPKGVATCAELAASLAAAASAHHGHALPEFLRALQAKLVADPDAVQNRLDRSQARFRKEAERAGFGGSPYRALRIAGAIYAAADLARHLKVLPDTTGCKKAALAVLEMHQATTAANVPFLERLEQLIVSGGLVTVDKRADRSAQAQAALSALGTLANTSAGRTIRIAPDKIMEAFPDWPRIKRSDEVRAFLKVDGRNLAVWGRLAPGTEQIRLFQFVLPPSAPEPTLFDNVEATGDE